MKAHSVEPEKICCPERMSNPGVYGIILCGGENRINLLRERSMRFSRLYQSAFSVLFLTAFFLPCAAGAAEQVTLYCQPVSKYLRLIKQALKYQVMNSIPEDQFSNVRVAVRTRKLSVQPASYVHNISDLLQDHGLNITRQDEEGLEFNVNGSWERSESDRCVFQYNIYITVTARRVSSGERLRYTTTSIIDISEEVNGRIRLQ